jgi:hypothetical protein
MSYLACWISAAMDFVEAHSGAVTAIATVFIAAFTRALMSVSRGQSRLIQRTLDHTIQTDVNTQRAYVSRVRIDVQAVFLADNPGRLRMWQLVPFWQNNGTTPARNVNFRSSRPIIIEGTPSTIPDFEPEFIDVENRAFITLGPNQPMGGGHVDVSPQDLIRLGRREILIFVVFRVEYNDVFEKTETRISQYCEQLIFTGTEPITDDIRPIGYQLPVTFYGHTRLQVFT